jgi:glutaredoxin
VSATRDGSMPEIIVYTQPGCHACALVTEWLAARGLAFTERDIRADADALATVQALGALSTPVTVIGEGAVIGFNRRKLESLLVSGQ